MAEVFRSVELVDTDGRKVFALVDPQTLDRLQADPNFFQHFFDSCTNTDREDHTADVPSNEDCLQEVVVNYSGLDPDISCVENDSENVLVETVEDILDADIGREIFQNFEENEDATEISADVQSIAEESENVDDVSTPPPQDLDILSSAPQHDCSTAEHHPSRKRRKKKKKVEVKEQETINENGQLPNGQESNDQCEALPEGYSYICAKNIIKVKEINSQQDAEDWLEKFSEISKITWRVAQTFPQTTKQKGKLYKFKKKYRCQHCTFHVQKTDRKTKNTNCPARMFVKIMKNPFTDDDDVDFWPCMIEFTNKHNHAIGVPANLRYRPLASETIDSILELFHLGHTPSSAYEAYLAKKKQELGDSFLLYSYDRAKIPTKEDVKNLWKKEFRIQYGGLEGKSILDSLKKKLVELKIQGHEAQISLVKERPVIALCTRLMQKIHSLQLASEMMFVDVKRMNDAQNHCIYFLAACCKGIGGLPLGIIITDISNHFAFQEGLRIFVQDFKNVFVKSPQTVVLSNTDSDEEKVLKTFFPKSVYLLSSFHVLKNCWKYLMSKSHNIPKYTRHQLFFKFKSMVYAKDIKEFIKSEFELKISSQQYPQFIAFLENMMSYYKKWAHCYQKKAVTEVSNINYITELMFRVLKDIPLERTKTFNLLQIVNFLCSTFEKYCTQRIMSVVNGSTNLQILKLLCPYLYDVSIENIAQLQEEMYIVKSKSCRKLYEVNMAAGFCSCRIGVTDRMCKHQLAIAENFHILDSVDLLHDEVKNSLFEIASAELQSDDENCSSLENPSHTVASEEVFSTQKDSNSFHAENEESTADLQNAVYENTYHMHQLLESEHANVKHSKEVSYALMLIEEFCDKLKDKVSDDPKNMVPAIEKFVKNFRVSSSSSSLLSSKLQTAFIGKVQAKIKKKKKFRRKYKDLTASVSMIKDDEIER